MGIPTVVKQLFNSEKAIAAGLLVISAVILLMLGRITVEQWMSYTQVLLGIYVGGKSVQGAAAALSQRPPSAPKTPEDAD